MNKAMPIATGTAISSASADVKSAPTVYAPALATTLTETCMGSTSGSGSGMGWGFSIGSTWTDKSCERRLNADRVAVERGEQAELAPPPVQQQRSLEERWPVYAALWRSISPIAPRHASEARTGLACNGATASGAREYGDSAVDSCVSAARP